MTHPGLVVVCLGITMAAFLYYMFAESPAEREGQQQQYSEMPQSSRQPDGSISNGTRRRHSEISRDSEQICTICLQQIPSANVVLLKPCKHKFHKVCILKWISHSREGSRTPECPNCRRSFTNIA